MSNIGNKTIAESTDSSEARLGSMVVRVQMAIRAGEVDREKTVDLFNRAMGPRSKRKFADDLGVNVSSVSRISNGQVNEINPSLLAKIAFYADPNSDVTLDQLMEAQGLIDSKERAKLSYRYEEECRRIMVDELLRRGNSVNYGSQPELDDIQKQMFADFVIKTNALGAEESRWIVECKMMSQYSMLPIGSGRSKIWIDSAMAYYYCGGEAGRISLIVDNRAVFEQMKKKMSELTVPDEISVILISTSQGKILDEYAVPLKDNRKPVYPITDLQETEK